MTLGEMFFNVLVLVFIDDNMNVVIFNLRIQIQNSISLIQKWFLPRAGANRILSFLIKFSIVYLDVYKRQEIKHYYADKEELRKWK